jgi:predicted transcriptional regulator
MKEITKAQEDLLKALWENREGAISDVLDILEEPKPAYNTVATVIKVLEKKGYVSHKTFGKTHVYYAVVSKKEYAQHLIKDTFTGLFTSSLHLLVSPFVTREDLSLPELEDLNEMLAKEIESKKH